MNLRPLIVVAALIGSALIVGSVVVVAFWLLRVMAMLAFA